MDFNLKLDMFRNHPVVNWHEHVWPDATGKMNTAEFERLMEHAELVGMNTLVISCPITSGHASPEQVELANNMVIQCMKRYPKKVRGMVFVDPIQGKYALQEIERCVKDFGMVGVKLYHQYPISDEMQYPIIEKCIELNIPILMHAGKLNQYPETQKNISDSTHFLTVAKKYPEAVFLMAHIGGGGDWNWQLKGMAECKNVYTDISGSVYDAPIIEEAVRVMGAERILFGTDGSFSAGIGKLLAAKISEDEKIIIMNNLHFEKYLSKEGYGC